MEAVIFDLDDTLCPVEAFVREGMEEVAAHVHIKYDLPEAGAFAKLMGLWRMKTSVYPRLFNDFLAAEKLPESGVQELVEIYNSSGPKTTKLPEGSVMVLKELRRQGMKLGILTDGNANRQMMKINALGLESWVDSIVLAGAHGTKLSRQPFEIMLGNLESEARQSTYIGDNPMTDFQIPKEMGMKTIRLVGGEFAKLSSRKDVDLEIKDIKDALKVLSW